VYKPKLQNKIACSLSIWFHDVIYDPKRSDNELLSIELFKDFTKEVEKAKPFEDQVSKYIRCTIDHKLGAEKDLDLEYFMDFDMAVLGKEPNDYAVYAKQIRNEYIHVPEDIYKSRRAAVLKKLGEGGIFITQDFITRFEEKAKKNMQNEINELSK